MFISVSRTVPGVLLVFVGHKDLFTFSVEWMKERFVGRCNEFLLDFELVAHNRLIPPDRIVFHVSFSFYY